MAVTAQFLKNIMTEARPIIERQMNDAKVIAGFRSVVADAGGDWGALKALIKASVQDDDDGGTRVQKIREKADCTSAYADMLGLANMNEKNFSTGEITEPGNQSGQPPLAAVGSASTGNAPDTIPATILPDPHLPTAADGQRGIQSSAADGAKTVGVRAPIAVGSAQAGTHYVQAGQAATLSPSSEPVSSQVKADRAGEVVSSPTSPAILSEKSGCLKLKDGHCKLDFETTALCWQCNAERMKAGTA